jgi:hypothetical protein
MSQLNRENGTPINLQNPLPVNDVSCAMDKESITGETVTFKTGAAGFTGTVSLDKKPIANLDGDKVGSFWRSEWNKVLSTNDPGITITSLTETATAAAVVLESGSIDLEEVLETNAGTLEYIIEVIDEAGGSLYAYVGGIAESGTSSTFTVYNSAAGSTQSWVGTLTDFDATDAKIRCNIYRNQTSISWTTGTVLTQEVALPDDIRKLSAFLDSLSNGQYAVNYETATLYYKKATTGTSDTIAYTVLTGRTAVVSGGGSTSATKTDDAAFTVATDQVTPIAAMADEASTDSVNEGDAGELRMTLDRILLATNSAQLGNGLTPFIVYRENILPIPPPAIAPPASKGILNGAKGVAANPKAASVPIPIPNPL